MAKSVKQAPVKAATKEAAKSSPAQPRPLQAVSADGKNKVSPSATEKVKGKTVTEEQITRINRASSDSPLTGSEEEYNEVATFNGIDKGNRNTQNREVEQGDSMSDRKADQE